MANQRPDHGEQRDLGGDDPPLQEQLEKLVKAEQRLYLSQRELGRQLRRVDALNQLALDAAATRDPEAVLELAMSMLLSIYPLEQGVGLLAADGGGLVPAAVAAVPGREGRCKERLGELRGRDPMAIELPAQPLLGREAELRQRGPGAVALLDVIEELFDGSSTEPDNTALILPLHGTQEAPGSAIVLRQIGRLVSFHEEVPSDKSLPFVHLVGQQVAAALANARLVASLQESYAKLELAQRELVARERFAALGELAAVVAHEVRNPLGVIFNSVSMLRRIARPPESVGPLLDIVDEEAARLNRIVSDLIEFARPASPTMRKQPVAAIAADVVLSARPDAGKRGVEVILTSDDDARAIVDEHLLRQALLNLITNAVQASRSGMAVQVRVASAGEGVVIEVEDCGSGVPEADLEQIFEPFYTTKATGTGLGLSVVKRFVDAHRGEIAVRSSDAGSVFTIRLDV